MSIEKLEEMFNKYNQDYINPIFVKQEMSNLFIMIVDILKDQSNEIANLRQEFSKKRGCD